MFWIDIREHPKQTCRVSMSSTSTSVSSLVPIHDLPPEILAQIFVLTIPPKGAALYGSNNTSQAAILSLVSARWPRVAIETPFIWATISITPIKSDFEAYKTALLLHIARPQDIPLSINIHLYTSPREDISPHKPLFTFIAQNAQRIRHFKFACLASDVWEQLMEVIVEPSLSAKQTNNTIVSRVQAFPIENLSFKLTAYDESDTRRIARTLRGVSFPGLHALNIACHNFGSTFTLDWAFPWDQLTSLSFVCHDDADVPHIIHSCPRLKRLIVGLFDTSQYSRSGRRTGWIHRGTEMAPSSLTELTLRIPNDLPAYLAMTHFLLLFSCPSLTSLSLKHEYVGGVGIKEEEWTAQSVRERVDGFHAALIHFLKGRSRCVPALSYLKLENVLVTEDSLRTLLQTLTSLEWLELVVDDGDRRDVFCRISVVDEVLFLYGSPQDSHLSRIQNPLNGKCRIVVKP
ncbi:hypothetical protein AAF712_009595 [Marasmius tenuissimus]|uniref:F-box domain-containing protein n=1 Tax=Marasmius tenuissimus TaxID=585030 RepID=A0ABR2ZQI3_9AGAR